MFAKCRPGRGRASRRAKLRQIRAFADRAKVIANAGISDVAISKGTMGALGCLVAAAIERAGAVEHTAKMEAERQTERFKSALRTPSPTISVRRTGMGPPIAKAIVEPQGGTMEVASQFGSGSVFTFSLPLDPCPAASEEVLRSDYQGSAAGCIPCVSLRLSDISLTVFLPAQSQTWRRISGWREGRFAAAC
jgi:hypothetical protein